MIDVKIDNAPDKMEKSKSTYAILQAIHEEGDEIINLTTQKFLANTKFNLILFLILFTTALSIVALTGAVVYLVKDTSANDGYLTSKGSDAPLATASAFSLSSEISSDSNLDEFADIDRVNLIFGEQGSQNVTTVSLIPTGFTRVICNSTQFSTCDSKFTVHMFTNDGIVIYHGKETFLTDPSDRLKALITLHHPHMAATQLAEHAHIHLNWWWVWRLITRWVWRRRRRGNNWVWEQVQESFWGWAQSDDY